MILLHTFTDQDSVVAHLIAKDSGKCSCWARRKRDPVWWIKSWSDMSHWRELTLVSELVPTPQSRSVSNEGYIHAEETKNVLNIVTSSRYLFKPAFPPCKSELLEARAVSYPQALPSVKLMFFLFSSPFPVTVFYPSFFNALTFHLLPRVSDLVDVRRKTVWLDDSH